MNPIGSITEERESVQTEKSTMEGLEYVFHVPIPFSRHSAGFRAVYKIADEVQKRGKVVAIAPLSQGLLGLPGYVPGCSPYKIPSVFHFSLEEQQHHGIHFYPEIVKGNPFNADRFVRYMGNVQRYPFEPDELVFVWKESLMARAQRLCIDVIEPELFYPKTEPGEGTLFYVGKGVGLVKEKPEDWRQIDHRWPADRKDLAEALRSADLLVCADDYTLLNVEAAICGTPVLIYPGAPTPIEPLFGMFGIALHEAEIPRARETAQQAHEHYEWVREEIAHDVDNFIERCEAHFGL